jgi:hypothetical protein
MSITVIKRSCCDHNIRSFKLIIMLKPNFSGAILRPGLPNGLRHDIFQPLWSCFSSFTYAFHTPFADLWLPRHDCKHKAGDPDVRGEVLGSPRLFPFLNFSGCFELLHQLRSAFTKRKSFTTSRFELPLNTYVLSCFCHLPHTQPSVARTPVLMELPDGHLFVYRSVWRMRTSIRYNKQFVFRTGKTFLLWPY